MPPAGIVGLGSHVPSKVMTNEDWAGLVETSDEWITTKTGIKERRIADPDVCTSDLAVIASQQAIEEAGLSPDDIDMLIRNEQPGRPPIFHGRNHATQAWVQKCGGLRHQRGMRWLGTCARRRIKICGNPGLLKRPRYWIGSLQQDPNWEDRGTCVLFGDGAGAAVLSEVGDGRGCWAAG